MVYTSLAKLILLYIINNNCVSEKHISCLRMCVRVRVRVRLCLRVRVRVRVRVRMNRYIQIQTKLCFCSFVPINIGLYCCNRRFYPPNLQSPTLVDQVLKAKNKLENQYNALFPYLSEKYPQHFPQSESTLERWTWASLQTWGELYHNRLFFRLRLLDLHACCFK